MTGLTYFEKFLHLTKQNETIEAIIPKLRKNEIDIYLVIEDFVNFLIQDLAKSDSNCCCL